jgi:hypothetical protein
VIVKAVVFTGNDIGVGVPAVSKLAEKSGE